MKLKKAEGEVDTECHYCTAQAVVHSDDTCDGCGEKVSMCEVHNKANVLLNTLDQVFNKVVEDLRKPPGQKSPRTRAMVIQAGLAGVELSEVSIAEFEALQQQQEGRSRTKH